MYFSSELFREMVTLQNLPRAERHPILTQLNGNWEFTKQQGNPVFSANSRRANLARNENSGFTGQQLGQFRIHDQSGT